MSEPVPPTPGRAVDRERSHYRLPVVAWLAAVGSLAGVLGCCGMWAQWPEQSLTVVSLAGLAGLLWLARRRAGMRVGPLFYYDLVRLARGRAWLLRSAYALVLLVVLYRVYSHRFPRAELLADPFAPGPTVPIRGAADFAGDFVFAIVVVQLVAVLVLTPAYLAGAVAGERERGTLDLLLTTELTDREIILGKLFSRLTYLSAVLLAGLPVLAMTQLWGGVPVGALAAGVVVTVLTLLAVGSLCMLCSVLAPSVLGALFASYGTVVGLFAIVALMIGTVGGILADGGGVLAGFVFISATVTVVCLLAAIRSLRNPGLHPTDNPFRKPPVEGPASEQAESVRALPLAVRRRWPVTDAPLLWKEVYHGADAKEARDNWELFVNGSWATFIAASVFWALVLFGHVVGAWHMHRFTIIAEPFNFFGRCVILMLGALWCARVGFRAAGSVTRERAQGTLDNLLVLPVEREAILRAKWLGALLAYRGTGCGLTWVALVGVTTGGLHPAGGLLLALATAAYLAFLAGVGLWLSVVCRRTLTANFLMGLTLLVMFGGSFLLPMLGLVPWSPSGDLPPWPATVLTRGLNPLQSWWYAAFPWGEVREPFDQTPEQIRVTVTVVSAGAVLYAVAGWLFWRAACRRIRGDETGKGNR